MSDLVLNGLVRKRAELTGEVQQLRSKLQETLVSVDSLGAAILVFDPHYKLESVKAKQTRKGAIQRGDRTRVMLDIMRNAGKSLTTGEIAGMIGSDMKRTGIALCGQRKRGTARSVPSEGRETAWEVA